MLFKLVYSIYNFFGFNQNQTNIMGNTNHITNNQIVVTQNVSQEILNTNNNQIVNNISLSIEDVVLNYYPQRLFDLKKEYGCVVNTLGPIKNPSLLYHNDYNEFRLLEDYATILKAIDEGNERRDVIGQALHKLKNNYLPNTEANMSLIRKGEGLLNNLDIHLNNLHTLASKDLEALKNWQWFIEKHQSVVTTTGFYHYFVEFINFFNFF